MQIEIVGRTTVNWSVLNTYMEDDEDAEPMEMLVEFSGRSCYQSFSKPNPKTARNADYIANIREQAHESVFEHASVSFYVQGTSRNMLLELERHRHLSFSVVSQRFVDGKNMGFVYPPALRKYLEDHNEVDDAIVRAHLAANDAYEAIEGALSDLPKKQRREAARAVLAGGTETKFVVTGNLRAWRDVLKKRYSMHADAEIRQFAAGVLKLLREEAPAVFADFPPEPFE